MMSAVLVLGAIAIALLVAGALDKERGLVWSIRDALGFWRWKKLSPVGKTLVKMAAVAVVWGFVASAVTTDTDAEGALVLFGLIFLFLLWLSWTVMRKVFGLAFDRYERDLQDKEEERLLRRRLLDQTRYRQQRPPQDDSMEL